MASGPGFAGPTVTNPLYHRSFRAAEGSREWRLGGDSLPCAPPLRESLCARLPRRTPGWHVASFIGGIVVGLVAAQFTGSGESAALPSAARMPSVQSAAPVPSSAALPSPAEVSPPTSGDKTIESGTAPKSSRVAETRGPVAPTKYQGGLRIDSRPAGAAVFVNNQEIGRTPIVLSSLQAGSRAVRLQLGGFAPWSRSVRVIANQQSTVLAVLEPSR